jgi:hypothetical protein
VIVAAWNQERRVNVAVVNVPPVAVREARDALERKRTEYWRNAPRNGLIASVARGVLSANWRRLRAHGLPEAVVREAGHGDRRVAMLVESPEHGRELKRLLPDWTLCDATTHASCDVHDGGPRIVTLVYAAKHGVSADVVIRATGTPFPLTVKNFPGARDEGDDRAVLLVDFFDVGSVRRENESRARFHDYTERGYHLVAPVTETPNLETKQ